MTNIKLKAIDPEYSFITKNKIYLVEKIDEDGGFVIRDDEGDTYYVRQCEIGKNQEWEKVSGFDKYDLLNGDVVILRNKRKYLFLKNYGGKEDVFVCCTGGRELLSFYDEFLCNTNDEFWDIMEVYRCDDPANWYTFDNLRCYVQVFKREDRKKMTVKDIEAALGYRIEVIDNE